MNYSDRDRLRAIKDFPALVEYLRDELDWPIDSEDFNDLTFDYEPEELGIEPGVATKIEEIKQLRPLTSSQPWGVFFIGFEPKRLPVVVLRRILSQLVFKKRSSAKRPGQASWHLNDLLFISACGAGQQREINLAHFSENLESGGLPTLRVLGWDDADRDLKIDHIRREMQEKLRWPDDPADLEAWRTGWASAFTLRPREVITTSKALAEQLAKLAGAVRARVNQVLVFEHETGPLRGLLRAFREALVHDLTEDGFADMYAQTLAYGLLSEKLMPRRSDGGSLGLGSLMVMNPFLGELLDECRTIGRRRGLLDFDELGVGEVEDLLNDPNTKYDDILRDFDSRNPTEDPVIHFYEHFLREYDAEQRVKRGVYYTPRPVVSFIVRSVDEILRTEFGLVDGLADTTTWGEMAARIPEIRLPGGTTRDEPFVQILDPATGTGTFLVEVVDIVYRTMSAKWKKAGRMPLEFVNLWNEYVPAHLLPRLHGFELMMAPYAIAHMKVGLKLLETGYRFNSTERVRILLTNSLEPTRDNSGQLEMFAPALAHEASAAAEAKRTAPITVVIGNPPYSAISANLTDECRAIVDPYRYVRNQRIRERSMLQFEKNIQDDYIKFIAWSQQLVERTGCGIVGFVTNHSYLDAPTLRGMRWSLLSSFDRLDIIDLHGNSNKKEMSSDGTADVNVFDIQQGVAVSLMRRASFLDNGSGVAEVRLAGLSGARSTKYTHLLSSTASRSAFAELRPKAENYFFVLESSEHEKDWESCIPLPYVLEKNLTGTTTGCDSLLLDFDRQSLARKIIRFSDTMVPERDLIAEHRIKGGHGRLLLNRRRSFDVKNADRYIRQFQVAPFDYRWAYLKKDLLQGHRFGVMENIGPGHPGLVATRQTKERFAVFIVGGFCGHKIISAYDRSYVFPLWNVDSSSMRRWSSDLPFLNDSIVTDLKETLDSDRSGHPSTLQKDDVESVFHYIYAVLNAPGYAALFGDRLKRDFPRVPITARHGLFHELKVLGADLAAMHLLDESYAAASWNASDSRNPMANLPELPNWAGNSVVANDHPKYQDSIIWVNRNDAFGDVPKAVWEFEIGGYRVCQKWLKNRRGRTLSEEDIIHYQKIVVALSETIRIMAEVDEAIENHGGWPEAFSR